MILSSEYYLLRAGGVFYSLHDPHGGLGEIRCNFCLAKKIRFLNFFICKILTIFAINLGPESVLTYNPDYH
jgi:hypothetical protein